MLFLSFDLGQGFQSARVETCTFSKVLGSILDQNDRGRSVEEIAVSRFGL